MEVLPDVIVNIVVDTVNYLEHRRSKNHFQILKLLLDKGMDIESMEHYPIGYQVMRLFYELLDERGLYYTNLDLGKRLAYPWLARIQLVKSDLSSKIVYIYIDGEPYRMTRKEATIYENQYVYGIID